MTIGPDATPRFAGFRELLYEHGKEVAVYAPEDYPETAESQIPIRELRRKRQHGLEADDPRVAMTLTDVNGVLRWNNGYGYRHGTGLRRSRMRLDIEGEIVAPVNFQKLEPSKIGEYLQFLDKKLTPQCDFQAPERGLRELVDGKFQNRGVTPIKKGRVLIFIHGTFSKNEMFLQELGMTAEGRLLLRKIQNKQNYDQVLAFDHATLSLSPVLNAMDLAHIFQDSDANIDVICHSRGGLVTRWWLETYKNSRRGATRAVMVGSPLAGTSLAAAPRLRAAINLLTNVARVLEKGAALASITFPFFTVITGLLRVLASAGTMAAKTPAFDAAVALIPGLSSQALVSNNEELNRLNRLCTTKPNYYAIRSDFKPLDPGWEFWKYFVGATDRLKDWAADTVFEEANDLVVDTASMTVLAKPPHQVDIVDMYDFRQSSRVHHTVYFRQPETAAFIVQCLRLN